MSARLEKARAEIARRCEITLAALTTVDDQLLPISPPTPWHTPHELTRRLMTSQSRTEHIAENSPAHVLAVLTAAAATLDRHAPLERPWLLPDERRLCTADRHAMWPCPEALAVLDLYAPDGTSETRAS
jgi:hypothetical protein